MRARRFVRGGPPRLTGWDIGPGLDTVETTAADSTLVFDGAANGDTDGLTIVRVRGEILVTASAVVNATDAFRFAFGIGLTSTEAFAAGAASLKTPLLDSDWDGWMWHSFGHIIGGLNATGVVGNPFAMTWRREIDTKAMRKFEEGMVLYCVGEFDELDDGLSLTIAASSRTLLKLP